MSGKVCTEFRTHTHTQIDMHMYMYCIIQGHCLLDGGSSDMYMLCNDCTVFTSCAASSLIFIFFQCYDFSLFSSGKIMKWYMSFLALFIHWNEGGFMFWIQWLLFLLCRVNCCWKEFAYIAQDVFTDQYVTESCFISCEVTLDDRLALEGMKWFICWCFQHHKLKCIASKIDQWVSIWSICQMRTVLLGKV